MLSDRDLPYSARAPEARRQGCGGVEKTWRAFVLCRHDRLNRRLKSPIFRASPIETRLDHGEWFAQNLENNQVLLIHIVSVPI